MARSVGTAAALLSLSALLACGTSVVAGFENGGSDAGPVAAASSGLVRGRVQGTVPAGSSATVFQLQSDGTLRALSKAAPVDTTDGTYSAEAQFNAAVAGDLVVRISSASDDGSGPASAQALISAQLPPGAIVTAPPAGARGGVLVDTAVAMRASGTWSTDSSTPQLDQLIDAPGAAALAASASYRDDIAAAARAAQAGMMARTAMLTDASVGVTAASISQLRVAELNAQIQEDSGLDAFSGDAATVSVEDARVQAEAQAASAAGISTAQLARASVAVRHASAAALGTASSGIVDAFSRRFAAVEAGAVEAADRDAFAALSASAQVQADVANAQSALDAAIASSDQTKVNFSDAWATYEATIKADLMLAIEADQPGASRAVNSILTGQRHALTALQKAVSAAGANTDALVQAYADYSAGMQSAIAGVEALRAMPAERMSATATILLDMTAQ